MERALDGRSGHSWGFWSFLDDEHYVEIYPIKLFHNFCMCNFLGGEVKSTKYEAEECEDSAYLKKLNNANFLQTLSILLTNGFLINY